MFSQGLWDIKEEWLSTFLMAPPVFLYYLYTPDFAFFSHFM